ncbi:MAG: hypothetical protein LBT43_06760 [Prevotella sp.]|jgi:hypothetical protein|nr:hypothetical protein [Prevotella sp.]
MITVLDLNYNEDNYNWWLTCMDDVLNYKCLLPNVVAGRLDYSVESLDIAEQYLLDNFNIKSIYNVENKYALDFFVRYVGKTFFVNIKNLKWFFILDDKNFYYGEPILTKTHTDLYMLISPLSFIISSLDRQKGNCMSKILRNRIADDND